MSLLRLLWSGYKNIQSKYPLLTASLSSGTIVSLADGSAQAIEGNGWNKRRTIGMLCHGLIFIGPVAHTWFNFLYKMIPIHLKQKPLGWLLLSVTIDQCLMSPNFTMAFFVTRGIIDQKNKEQIVDKIKNDTIKVWLNSVYFWGPVALGNFYFTPIQHRVLVLNSASFIWNMYMASISKYHHKKEEQ